MANGSAHLPCYLFPQTPQSGDQGSKLEPGRNVKVGTRQANSNPSMAFLAGFSSALVWRCGYVALWLCSYVCNCMEMLLCGNKIICVPTTCLRIRPKKLPTSFRLPWRISQRQSNDPPTTACPCCAQNESDSRPPLQTRLLIPFS